MIVFMLFWISEFTVWMPNMLMKNARCRIRLIMRLERITGYPFRIIRRLKRVMMTTWYRSGAERRRYEHNKLHAFSMLRKKSNNDYTQTNGTLFFRNKKKHFFLFCERIERVWCSCMITNAYEQWWNEWMNDGMDIGHVKRERNTWYTQHIIMQWSTRTTYIYVKCRNSKNNKNHNANGFVSLLSICYYYYFWGEVMLLLLLLLFMWLEKWWRMKYIKCIHIY